jgi:hypothetical protein
VVVSDRILSGLLGSWVWERLTIRSPRSTRPADCFSNGGMGSRMSSTARSVESFPIQRSLSFFSLAVDTDFDRLKRSDLPWADLYEIPPLCRPSSSTAGMPTRLFTRDGDHPSRDPDPRCVQCGGHQEGPRTFYRKRGS